MQLVQAFFREAKDRVQMFDYDVRTDGQPVYIGHAPKGTAESSGGWTLYKYTYNGSNQITMIQSVGGIWSLRTQSAYWS